MAQLGARYNVALGSSSGGQAAFAFGTRCKMDKIIAFSPAFPHSVYRSPGNALRSLFSVGNLFREPQAYLETMIVTLAVIWMEDVTARRARLNVPLDHPIERTTVKQLCLTLRHHSRCMKLFRSNTLSTALLKAEVDPRCQILKGITSHT